jgi:hypothetical protein
MREIHRDEANGDVTVTTEIDSPRGKLTAVTSQNRITHTTWTTKYPVESLEDIEKIRSIPWELPRGIRTPDTSRLPPDFPERGVTYTGISSPFVCVAGMMPYQYFLELCATEPRLLYDLTAVCLDRILCVLDVLLAGRNIEWVWMGGCEWVTPPMASPQVYEDLVQQFERPIIDRIHRAGAISHVHCHGHVRTTLPLVIDRGADYFEPVEPPPDGDITFVEAKALAAGRITLGGNVEARVLEGCDRDAAAQATRAAFEGTKEHMALQNTAGPVSRVTPGTLANYHRMIDVWEELSPLA